MFAAALVLVVRMPVSYWLAEGAGQTSLVGALFYLPIYAAINAILGGVLCSWPLQTDTHIERYAS
jgi:hypothetical protein